MTSLALVVIATLCAVALGNRYDDILADMYGRDLGEAGYLYAKARSGVANRASRWYGDLLSGTQTRDQEYEPQIPALYGYKYMTGGAGEGKQHLTPSGKVPNKQQVKTDKVLPAYCNPPNPCPVGYTAKDNCVEMFENSADNNRKYNGAQKCSCDAEHMFECPDDKNTISAKVHGGDDEVSSTNLGDVISQLVDMESGDIPYMADLAVDEGKDHATISKKSMLLSRKKRMIEVPENDFDVISHKVVKKSRSERGPPPFHK